MKTFAIKSSLILLLIVSVFYVRTSSAQEPPHPPSTGHGQPGNQSPSNAPVGEGAGILTLIAGIYLLKNKVKYKESESVDE